MTINYTALNYGSIKPDKYGRYEIDKKLVAVSVLAVSQSFGISTRRVRQMLSDGKLKGTKYGKHWLVDYPYQIVMGRRGPVLGAMSWKKRTSQRNIKDFENYAFKKGT